MREVSDVVVSATSHRLPRFAYSALNRCNLPAVILGSCTYQHSPTPLEIDGVAELHSELFRSIEQLPHAEERALHFRQYMRSAFLLDHLDEAGFNPNEQRVKRGKADYLRLLRGWMFNPDGIEAAVLKRWVESRFGLLAQSHRGVLDHRDSPNYQGYQADYMRGLYNSNALEAQLDVLYSYCQFELARRWPSQLHRQLFRGTNRIETYNRTSHHHDTLCPILLNNLNSFSDDAHLCELFGDVVLEVKVPTSKILYFPELLPGVLQGEGEYLVLGGLYQALEHRGYS